MEFWIEEPGRLDTVCAAEAGVSRSRAARFIEMGLCKVDGAVRTKVSQLVLKGQKIELEMPRPQESEIQAEDIPIKILYEDQDLAVVEKPRGMVVHPAAGNETGTLVNALLGKLDSLSGIGGVIRPGIIHRLDKETSGLLIIAKNDEAHMKLSNDLSQRVVEKHYLAVTEGNMKELLGRIDAPIGRSKTDRKKMAVCIDGREAVTEWKLLENLRGASLLDVHILTGRTHQIRVHMQSIHHPLAGDTVYGTAKGVKAPCLMLHAYSLAFQHPSNQKRMHFILPPPKDFQSFFQTLRQDKALPLPFENEIRIE